MPEKKARTEAPGPLEVKKSDFGTLGDGRVVHRYDLSNGSISVSLIDYGAHIISVKVSDKDGNLEEVTLCRDTLDDIVNNSRYFGSTVGRIANRVGNATFTLDSKEYKLAANNGPNHLHGGNVGLDKVLWESEEVPSNEEEGGKKVGVRFTYLSSDGEEGYPGDLKLQATYSLTLENELEMSYEAEATGDKASPVALTNHAYWNLSGGLKSKVTAGQTIRVQADKYLVLGEHMIPTGEQRSVEATPFDLRAEVAIGDRVPQVDGGGKPGFDHCFVVDGYKPLSSVSSSVRECLRLMAVLKDPKSGRAMDVYGTQPGIQVYTANFLSEAEEEDDAPATQHNAVCLETEYFPNAINDPSGLAEQQQDIIVRPGGPKYQHLTVHRFYLVDDTSSEE